MTRMLIEIDCTQKVLAKKMNVTQPYVSMLLNFRKKGVKAMLDRAEIMRMGGRILSMHNS